MKIASKCRTTKISSCRIGKFFHLQSRNENSKWAWPQKGAKSYTSVEAALCEPKRIGAASIFVRRRVPWKTLKKLEAAPRSLRLRESRLYTWDNAVQPYLTSPFRGRGVPRGRAGWRHRA